MLMADQVAEGGVGKGPGASEGASFIGRVRTAQTLMAAAKGNRWAEGAGVAQAATDSRPRLHLKCGLL
jgi:hypothetical protein